MSYSMAVVSCELWKKSTIQVAFNCANKKRAKEQARRRPCSYARAPHAALGAAVLELGASAHVTPYHKISGCSSTINS